MFRVFFELSNARDTQPDEFVQIPSRRLRAIAREVREALRDSIARGSEMNGSRKINRIRQIVQLRQIMKRWHALALKRKVSASSPAFYDSDEELCRTPVSAPPDVPEGYLAVYVGRERRRFIIPTDYLSRPVFRTLLDRAEEEFGFDHKGGLTIPCETEVFEHLLRALARNESVENINLYCKERGSPAGSVYVHSNLLHESII